MTENERPQLEYAQASPWHRRRSARRVVMLCFALLVLGAGLRWGNQFLNRVKAKYLFAQCMNWTPPADRVGFDEPRDSGWVVWRPEPWMKFYQLYGGSAPVTSGTLFLHGRTSRGGNVRLVALDVVSTGKGHTLLVQSRVFEPPVSVAWAKLKTATVKPVELPEGGGLLRIYSGRIDPQDASHFTMEYVIGEERRGIIDGWLKDDETVVVEPRSDVATTSPSHTPSAR